MPVINNIYNETEEYVSSHFKYSYEFIPQKYLEEIPEKLLDIDVNIIFLLKEPTVKQCRKAAEFHEAFMNYAFYKKANRKNMLKYL